MVQCLRPNKRNEMIITIANQKGGVGKSTIATNLAAIFAQNKLTLLIDHDTSHVSANFHKRRENFVGELPAFTLFMPQDLDEMTELLEMDKFDTIIVDLGGFNDELARAALIYADLIVIPTSISTPDMDGNIHFMDALDKLRALGMDTKAVCVANNTNPRMKQPRIDVELDYITDRGYKLIATIPHYAAFSASHGMGLSIVEFAETSKAAAAMINLVEKIVQEVQDEPK